MRTKEELEFVNKVGDALNDALGAENVLENVVISMDGSVLTSASTTFGADEGAMASNALQTKMFKLRKKIPQDMVEDIEALDEDGLRARIVLSEANLHENEQAMNADEELAALKLQLKEAKAPYGDVKKLQTAIAQYATCLRDQRGKL